MHNIFGDPLRVNNNLLIENLEDFEFPLWILDSLNSDLNASKRVIKIKNHMIDPILVCSGVPQTFYFGPLLLNLFINDFVISFKSCKYLLFAYNIKIYIPVFNIDNYSKLQHDIDDTLINWCATNSNENNILLLFHTYSHCSMVMYYRWNSLVMYLLSDIFKQENEISWFASFQRESFYFKTNDMVKIPTYISHQSSPGKELIHMFILNLTFQLGYWIRWQQQCQFCIFYTFFWPTHIFYSVIIR